MGLKAIENGVMRFTNVRVPRENILWGEGKGLKLALITLNTGRLTLPASCAGGGKAMLQVARTGRTSACSGASRSASTRRWRRRSRCMAANTFAMEAVARARRRACAERGQYDIRLEAAIAKMWNTETGWRIVDDTLQIRGGRGYETADSLRARGEPAIPIERAMRDFRINLIFEGSSEIMRLFIAREAVDHHFKTAFALVDKESLGQGEDRRARPRGEVLPGLVSRALVRPRRGARQLRRVRRAREAPALGRAAHAAARAHAVPRDGALRPEARAAADGALPRRSTSARTCSR